MPLPPDPSPVDRLAVISPKGASSKARRKSRGCGVPPAFPVDGHPVHRAPYSPQAWHNGGVSSAWVTPQRLPFSFQVFLLPHSGVV